MKHRISDFPPPPKVSREERVIAALRALIQTDTGVCSLAFDVAQGHRMPIELGTLKRAVEAADVARLAARALLLELGIS